MDGNKDTSVTRSLHTHLVFLATFALPTSPFGSILSAAAVASAAFLALARAKITGRAGVADSHGESFILGLSSDEVATARW